MEKPPWVLVSLAVNVLQKYSVGCLLGTPRSGVDEDSFSCKKNKQKRCTKPLLKKVKNHEERLVEKYNKNWRRKYSPKVSQETTAQDNTATMSRCKIQFSTYRILYRQQKHLCIDFICFRVSLHWRTEVYISCSPHLQKLCQTLPNTSQIVAQIAYHN